MVNDDHRLVKISHLTIVLSVITGNYLSYKPRNREHMRVIAGTTLIQLRLGKSCVDRNQRRRTAPLAWPTLKPLACHLAMACARCFFSQFPSIFG